ncbi:MAG: PAS domain-containing protein [Coleofasciculaceae cyanobacterium SM2_3_26]|nr:PAS domain-containing protein [Coleofasciculaceae cyanobacterium SM2_3_26]
MTARPADPHQQPSSLRRMAIALDSVRDAIAWTDREARLQWCNRAGERLLGQPRAQLLGQKLCELLPLADLPIADHPAHQALRGSFPPRQMMFQRPTTATEGDRHYRLEVSGELDCATEGEPIAILTLRMIEEKPTSTPPVESDGEAYRLRQEVDLLQNIYQAVYTAMDTTTALRAILGQMCAVTGWQYGEAWLPVPDGSALVCGCAWYDADARSPERGVALEYFQQHAQGLTLLAGEALAGRVWVSQQPEWSEPLETGDRDTFLRAELAIACGFQAGYAVPILLPATSVGGGVAAASPASQVLAVLVFLPRHPLPATNQPAIWSEQWRHSWVWYWSKSPQRWS